MPTTNKLTPEMLVPRLGDYLVKSGHISAADLQKALAYQKEKTADGEGALIGQTLLELGIVSKEMLDQAITEQIIQLRSALQATNRTLERRVQERTSELQNALERLADLSELKSNFISNISHELRTPLTHIKGYLELMVSESLGPISDEQKHALQVSQRSTVRLESLIEDLIMASVTARGELTLKQDAVDIRRIAHLTVKGVMDKAEERGVEVHAVVDKKLPPVQADSQKLSWVLGQLLDNGIKFTPAGGRVILRVEHESEKLISISVTDTGIGIPADRINELFQPFHQLDGTTTRRHGGTGLGLLLVREIVEAHGSMLEVKSVEGRGTTVKFPLLVAKEK
jgi:signal transduction histidine kinase